MHIYLFNWILTLLVYPVFPHLLPRNCWKPPLIIALGFLTFMHLLLDKLKHFLPCKITLLRVAHIISDNTLNLLYNKSCLSFSQGQKFPSAVFSFLLYSSFSYSRDITNSFFLTFYHPTLSIFKLVIRYIFLNHKFILHITEIFSQWLPVL